MRDVENWIYFGLVIFFILLFLIWHRQNKRLLTHKDKRKLSDGIADASRRELRYIWLPIVFFVLIGLLQKLFGLPSIILGLVMVVFLIYGFARNILIYKRENLPAKFIKSEILLAVVTSLFITVWTIWDDWQ